MSCRRISASHGKRCMVKVIRNCEMKQIRWDHPLNAGVTLSVPQPARSRNATGLLEKQITSKNIQLTGDLLLLCQFAVLCFLKCYRSTM